MRVHLGGDHAAYALQRALVDHLTAAGHEVIDHGPLAYDAMDDYPVFVLRAAQAVAADPGSAGIVLGGSGNGEVMAANKVPGIRAAYAASIELAELA
ncbi:MAG TPA: RpiB/LacA/LacB family sugar-phosphate isomerase, partial [Dermatophilaceae bacterium]|nr:RpiB/LacA/LacB family sugar-phosphate isomerase [Dermatophilaceae bacterium]